jgi:hypothetical protein
MTNVHPVYCPVLEKVVLEEKCPLKLAQITSGKKCLGCFLYQSIQLRSKLEEMKSLFKKRNRRGNGFTQI